MPNRKGWVEMIYLMRHGADAPNRYGGWSSLGLTDVGKQQACAASFQLLGKGIREIYSSDLTRAKETAQIIAEELCLPVIYLPEFREVNNGYLAGMLKEEAARKYPGKYWSALDWAESWPGGESPQMFYHRIKTAWYEFKEKVHSKTVLLVSHGGVMNVILCLENNTPYTNKETQYKIRDAEIIGVDK